MEYRSVSFETAFMLKSALRFVSDPERPILSGLFFNEKHMISANGIVVNIQEKPLELSDLDGTYQIVIIGRVPGIKAKVIMIERIDEGHKYPDIYNLYSQQKSVLEIAVNPKLLGDICNSQTGGVMNIRFVSENGIIYIQAGNDNYFMLMPIFRSGEVVKMPARPEAKIEEIKA